MWEILVAVAIILFIYLVCIKPYNYWTDRGVPSDKAWPFVGSMGPFFLRLKSVPDWTKDMYNSHVSRYIGFYQTLTPTLMIKDIDLIKQITIKDFDSFVDHRSLIDEEADPLFGKNLFSLHGQKWKQMRSTLSPAFTSSKMKAMFTLISESAEQLTAYFAKTVTPGETLTVEMKDVFTRYANDVIATTAFGIKCDSLQDRENEFYMMGKDSSNFSGLRNFIFVGYIMMPKIMKLFSVKLFSKQVSSFFRDLVKNTIMTREKQGIIRPDMIHLLMEARKGKLKHHGQEDDDTGFATVQESQIGKEDTKHELSDDDITSQALLFFIAGFDTISTGMCFMSHELALNPDIQKRLQEEIDETLAECDGKITYEAVQKMKYLDMVLTETLRKWPPAALTDRLCTKSYTIDAIDSNERPVHIKKNNIVWIPIYAIHRDPQYYPDPDKFDPERFSDENKDAIKPMSYLPFGIGPRNCIGSRFALLEAKTLYCHLLSKFDIVVVDKTQIPLRLSAKQFNVNSERGFWLGLKLRNKK